MKNIILILIAIVILSCSSDEDCDCIKTSYEIQQYTYFENGLPKTRVRTVITEIEETNCADEERVNQGSNHYYEITCE